MSLKIDIDQILRDTFDGPAAIVVDGAEHAVRDLATADVLRFASLNDGAATRGPDQVAEMFGRLRDAVASFFTEPPALLATWGEQKLRAVFEALMADWKARAEKNSRSISARISAEVATRTPAFATLGSSTPPSSTSPPG